jgi:hypothetical protein
MSAKLSVIQILLTLGPEGPETFAPHRRPCRFG